MEICGYLYFSKNDFVEKVSFVKIYMIAAIRHLILFQCNSNARNVKLFLDLLCNISRLDHCIVSLYNFTPNYIVGKFIVQL